MTRNRKKWKCSSDPKFNRIRDSWYKINNRCYNYNNKDYKNYGQRGIKVYSFWRNNLDSYYNYCIKLENAFEKNYSIDRINNNGNYEPGNIRFVLHKVQCNNRRSNRLYEYKGKTKNIAQWAEQYNLKWEFVRDRLALGWSIEEALTIPRYQRRKN